MSLIPAFLVIFINDRVGAVKRKNYLEIYGRYDLVGIASKSLSRFHLINGHSDGRAEQNATNE